MRLIRRSAELVFLAIAAAIISLDPAAARDSVTPPRNFPVETPQEATAPLYGRNYAVVAPIFNGSDGNVSFLRLSNVTSAASTFIVTVVGSPTGKVYGVANITVPSTSSPQYAISDILTLAGASSLSGGDTAYALYLQDSDPVSFQHVIYNGTNGSFENASTCQYQPAPASQPVLVNVHTSRLATYPSRISLHNYYNAAVTYRVQVFDSATGLFIGNVPFPAAANSTYLIPESYFEQQMGWTPGAGQSQVNLKFTADGIDQTPAVVSNLVFNQQLKAYLNMSAVCSVNDNDGICIRDPNGLSHGCVKGSNLVGGTLGRSAFALTVADGGNGAVEIAPQGFICASGAQCNLLVVPGTEVKLTAVPAAGADFLGWSGECTGTETTCVVAMRGDLSVIATFTSTGY